MNRIRLARNISLVTIFEKDAVVRDPERVSEVRKKLTEANAEVLCVPRIYACLHYMPVRTEFGDNLLNAILTKNLGLVSVLDGEVSKFVYLNPSPFRDNEIFMREPEAAFVHEKKAYLFYHEMVAVPLYREEEMFERETDADIISVPEPETPRYSTEVRSFYLQMDEWSFRKMFRNVNHPTLVA